LPEHLEKMLQVAAEIPMDFQHPELRDLLALWNKKRGSRRMPAWPDFSVPELKSWLGNLNLLDILDGGADFRFRVHGTKVAATVGVDQTGRLFSELPPSVGVQLRADYSTAVREGRPSLVVRPGSVYKDFMPTEKLILPLSKDDTLPDMLLAGVYVGKPNRTYPGC
jgi:hypothetical protein